MCWLSQLDRSRVVKDSDFAERLVLAGNLAERSRSLLWQLYSEFLLVPQCLRPTLHVTTNSDMQEHCDIVSLARS